MKVLFQELCKCKIGWDDELPEHLQRKWNAWCDELQKVGFIRIPRCYLHKLDRNVLTHQLHGFCDSSQSGYAAVVYLRVTTKDQCQSELVVSKTRVAPLSKLSIPRLELLSALIKGSDGQARGARVVVSKKGRRQTFERSLQHLYPLEVCCQTADPPPVLQSNQQNAVVQVPNQQRPRRAAAVRATRRIREFIDQLEAD